jgi:hypothetical protein
MLVISGVKNLSSSRLLSKNLKIKIHRTIILPIVLYRCETWSLTVREERRLRTIFGPKRDEVTGEWRKLHNEELHDLYSSPNIVGVIKSRRMRWAGHVAQMVDERGVYNHWGDPGVDGRIILGWIFRKWGYRLD